MTKRPTPGDQAAAHYASGCAVLLQAYLHIDELQSLRSDEGGRLWRPGPLVVTRRSASDEKRYLDHNDRAKLIGQDVSRLVLEPPHRLHRFANSQILSVQSKNGNPDRQLTVTCVEVIAADQLKFSQHLDHDNVPWTPGIVVAHLDLPRNDDALGLSQLTADHIANLLNPLLSSQGKRAKRFFDEIQDLANNTGMSPVSPDYIRLLGALDIGKSTSLPMYTILTDVSGSLDEDQARMAADRQWLAEHRADEEEVSWASSALDAELTDIAAIRQRRSRGLATLHRKIWLGRTAETTLETGDGPDPINWRGWSAAFGRSGAGFSFIPDQDHSSSSPYRRDHLSTIFVDIVALELLKELMLTRFSSDARHALPQRGTCETSGMPDDDCQALELWRSFVLFTTEYVGRLSGMGNTNDAFRRAVRAGLGQDFDQDLARTQDNLERLAQISRLEQAQRASEIESRQEKVAKRRTAQSQRFNEFVAILAAVFLPLTAIPPVLEWYYANPDPATVGARWVWFVGVSLVMIVAVLLVSRKLLRERPSPEGEPADHPASPL